MYTDKLPENISLQIYKENDDSVYFQSSGKWLYPLFEFEDFLNEKKVDINSNSVVFFSNDSSIGKAAAALSIKLGIRKLHAKTVSECALQYIDFYNKKNQLSDEEKITINYENLVPKLLCKTESILSEINDEKEIYEILVQRAGR